MTPRPRHNLDKLSRRLLRHYTRGFLVLAVLVLAVRLGASIWPAEEAESFWAWFSTGADRWVLTIAVILFLPLLVGWIARALMLPLFLGRRELRALLAFESRLVTELAPDEKAAVRVVLVEFPRADVRTIGVLTSVFPDPETGAELAAVFLPKGTDVRKGDIRIVPYEKVHFTYWTLREYLALQWSFGAVVPHQDEGSRP